MEIPNVVSHQYAFLLPVGLVIICAVLVFAFGFKSSVEPPSFKQLSFSSDERKAVKKRKLKDKKTQSNGHATVVIEESDNKKSDQSNKTLKQSNKIETVKTKRSEETEKLKEKKQDAQKSPSKNEKKVDKKIGKENVVDAKNKKNAPKSNEDKPTDFDDGEWETAFSRKDKKNRKKDDDILAVITPEKTGKKKTLEKKDETENEKSITTEADAAKINAETQKEVPETPTEVVLTPVAKTEEKEDVTDKKKKTKKSKTSAIEKAGEENAPVPEVRAEDKVKASAAEPGKSIPVKESEQTGDSQSDSQQPVSGAVFDELGDVWKEAPQKKSKKKVRKD